MRLFGHHKDGLDIGRKPTVHVGELQLVLKIADSPEAAQNHFAAALARVIHKQGLGERVDLDSIFRKRLTDELDALLNGKKRGGFPHVVGHSDDDAIEDLKPTLHNRHVAVGEGIEASWINGELRHGFLLRSSAFRCKQRSGSLRCVPVEGGPLRIYLLIIAIFAFGACSDSNPGPATPQDMANTADQSTFCEPGARVCKDLLVSQVCAADGSAWRDETCDAELRCNEENGQCMPEICTPGGFDGCTDTGLIRYCNTSGTAIVENVCPGNALCEDGACGTPQCEVGETRCIGTRELEICNEAGVRVPGGSCPLGTECFNGVCEELCELNKKISSYIGCEYWSADLDNYDDALSQPHAIVVSNINPELDAKVELWLGESGTRLTTDANGQPFQQTIRPGEAAIYSIPVGYDHSGTRVLTDKAIRVTANIPIIAYQFNPLNNVDVYSNDGTLLLPTHALGNEYWGMSWPYRQGPGLRGFLTVINSSGQPNRITIRPSAQVLAGPDIPAMEPGTERTIELLPGQSLNLTSSGVEYDAARESGCLQDSEGPPQNVLPCPDLTGTHILAEQPITVFGGHQCANVVQGVNRCDHIESVLFPVSAWGQNYVGSKFKPRAAGDFPEPDVWRIVAAEDNTQIQTQPVIEGIHGQRLNAGEWRQFESTTSFVLGASKPVSLAQYMVGSNWFGIPRICNTGIDAQNPTGIGDPAMALAVPVDQFRRDYLILTPQNYTEDYINVVVPAGREVRYDGTPIERSKFTPVGNGTFESTVIQVTDGFHRLDGDAPFGVMSYGYACHVSYAYPGGLNLEAISERD